ncbi:MAG: radical SAM protein [Firmicutes bacterium]|nr:radical SAM protein [Bacillota bacterium]
MKPSAGTASVLGMNRIKMEDPPTCAYIMLGSGCRNSCLFCAQGSRGKEENCGKDPKFLSRVNWESEKDEKVLQAISGKFETGDVKRVCYQVTDSPDVFEEVLSAVKKTKKLCDVPICVSITGISEKQIDELIEAGAEKIAFSFDAANPELFAYIKGRKWEDEWALYEKTVKHHPKVPVIHLIAGLGETEKEMAESVTMFYAMGSHVSLFAFTPLPKTPLAGRKQPELSSYRKLQTVLYIIRKRKEIFEKIILPQVENYKNPEIQNENSQKTMPFTGETKKIENPENVSPWNKFFGLKKVECEIINQCEFLLSGTDDAEAEVMREKLIISESGNLLEKNNCGKNIPDETVLMATDENGDCGDCFTKTPELFDKTWLKHDIFRFEDDKIVFNRNDEVFLKKNIPSEAYQTFGCADCNRPFYNEKPNQTPYNYPRVLTKKELQNAVELVFG